ncbi:MAG TPA: hypothetical protein VKY92_09035 [Verrucomicrobiae bacterium]|nr:hypothetical protein [Verrucomicrobiae bacterium]
MRWRPAPGLAMACNLLWNLMNRQTVEDKSATSHSAWPWVRWGLLPASALAILTLFYARENWRGKRDWERYQRQLSAQGHAIAWEAYIPPAVPDDLNIFADPNITAWFVGRGGNALSLQITSQRGVFLEQRNTNCLLQVRFVAPNAEVDPRENDLILEYHDHVLSLGGPAPKTFAAPAIFPKIVMDATPLSAAIENLTRQIDLQCTIDPGLKLNRDQNDPPVSIAFEGETGLGALLRILESYDLSLELDPGMRAGKVVKRTGRSCSTTDAQVELAKLIATKISSLTNDPAQPSAAAASAFTTFVRSPPRVTPGRIVIRSEQVPAALEVGKLFSRRVASYFLNPEQMRAELQGTNCFDVRLSPGRYTPAADYLEWSDRLEPQFNALRQALKKPFARMPGDYSNPTTMPVPNFVVIRTVVQCLSERAQCHLILSQPEAALEDLELMHGLCRILEGPPGGKPETLVAAMIDVAVRGLYVGTVEEGLRMNVWREPQLGVLQDRLSNINLLPIVAESFETERASVCGMLEKATYQQFDNLLGRSAPTTVWERLKDPRYTMLAMAPQGWFYQNRRTVALREQHAIEALDCKNGLILPQKAREFEDDMSKSHGLSPYDFLADLVPNAGRAIQTLARNQVLVREAVVVCALERYRLVTGRYPDRADMLKPRFLTSMPGDLFGGASLKYHLGADGRPVVYSIGWNEKDDHGVPGTKEPHGFDLQNGDWVWSFGGSFIK